jgi:hypothetical protein
MPTATFYGSVTQTALAEYFVKRFNMVGRDAEYSKNRPTLGWMPRDTEKLKQGDGFYETVKIAGGWGGTPDWVTGNQDHSVSTKMRWAVTDPYVQYARITFDNLTLNRNNLGTLIDLKGSEAEDVRDSMLNTLEYQLWSDGNGSRGKIETLGGSEATRVLTLHTASDVYNFPHGTLFQGSTTASGGTLHSDIYKVTGIDPVGGKITAVQVTNTSSQDLQDEDFLHVISSKAAVIMRRIWPRVAPTARRVPISLVRSRTLIASVLMRASSAGKERTIKRTYIPLNAASVLLISVCHSSAG